MKTKTLKRPASLSACVGLTLAVTVCTLSLPVQAQMPDISSDYTIQVLEPPQGTGSILALFINDNGMVVINYWGQNSVVCGSAAILEKGA